MTSYVTRKPYKEKDKRKEFLVQSSKDSNNGNTWVVLPPWKLKQRAKYIPQVTADWKSKQFCKWLRKISYEEKLEFDTVPMMNTYYQACATNKMVQHKDFCIVSSHYLKQTKQEEVCPIG